MKSWNHTTVRAALEPYEMYRDLYDSVKASYDPEERKKTKQRNVKSMEDMLFSETAKLYELAMDQQFHYAVVGAIYYMVKLLLTPILYGGLYDDFLVLRLRQTERAGGA